MHDAHLESIADVRQLRALGQGVGLLDREAMQSEVHSPTYVGGLWRKSRDRLGPGFGS